MSQTEIVTAFEEDVISGLKQSQKTLSSKYFYDEIGDELFQRIMNLDEYYLTRKELEIFNEHKQSILEAIYDGEPIRIIELGAGDGLKTKILLKHFVEQGVDFTYSPVDISDNVLDILEQNMLDEIPDLHFEPFHGDYFDALGEVASRPEKDVVFFLGSNIGNFEGQTAIPFLTKLESYLKKNDELFIGVDLKKDPQHILNAYNDKEGITRAFNMNLLSRINKELDGTFEISNFQHYPYYNPQTGECRSYIISKIDQDVFVSGEKIHFRAWEAIFMEVSKKYDDFMLQELATKSGFFRKDKFFDSQQWFTNQVWVNK